MIGMKHFCVAVGLARADAKPKSAKAKPQRQYKHGEGWYNPNAHG